MKVVVDRIVQYPNRFQLVDVSTSEVLGVFDLSAVTGTIQQVGTEIDAELFQSIQDDLTELAQDIVAESNARGVDVEALQNSIATKITANGGELGNAVVTFTEVSNATNIASGEKASTLFGKIRNWFSRLKALAFKDTIADADISSNANISQSKVSGLTAMQNKLNGIDAGANKYTLPVSTATNLGGVKVGSRLSVSADGTLSANVQTDNNYTTNEKNKLAGIENGAQKNAVTSVAGKTGAVTLDKSNVGLGNVDNERQYSASNPPPYPVTSVNGETGAVNITESPIINDNGNLRFGDYILLTTNGNIPTERLFKDIWAMDDSGYEATGVTIDGNGITYVATARFFNQDEQLLATFKRASTLPIIAGNGVEISSIDGYKAKISASQYIPYLFVLNTSGAQMTSIRFHAFIPNNVVLPANATELFNYLFNLSGERVVVGSGTYQGKYPVVAISIASSTSVVLNYYNGDGISFIAMNPSSFTGFRYFEY